MLPNATVRLGVFDCIQITDMQSMTVQAPPYTLSSPARAAMTKYHSLGGLNSTQLFLIALESGKPKIKVPAGFGVW